MGERSTVLGVNPEWVYLENKQDPVYIDDLEMQWITAVWP